MHASPTAATRCRTPAPVTSPSSSATPGARVGSVVGRYWAMDRDRRWERTQRAYDLLVHGARRSIAPRAASEAVRAAYERGETDEFIEPTLVGEPAPIGPGDSVICFNFRPDRMREIDARARRTRLRRRRRGAARLERARRRRAGRALATLTRVRGGLALPGRLRARAPGDDARRRARRRRRAQLHVAETEKYPHVTYFFNGGEEAPLHGERRELVALAARRADLRPQAADERARGRARVRRCLARGSPALRDHQLRERRHGRPHRRDRRRRARRRDRRRVPRRGASPPCTRAAASAS